MPRARLVSTDQHSLDSGSFNNGYGSRIEHLEEPLQAVSMLSL